jgi:hypothetical protein
MKHVHTNIIRKWIEILFARNNSFYKIYFNLQMKYHKLPLTNTNNAITVRIHFKKISCLGVIISTLHCTYFSYGVTTSNFKSCEGNCINNTLEAEKTLT